jgi:hypothetical protein
MNKSAAGGYDRVPTGIPGLDDILRERLTYLNQQKVGRPKKASRKNARR